MKRKLLLLVLSLVLVVCLISACGRKPNASKPATSSKQEESVSSKDSSSSIIQSSQFASNNTSSSTPISTYTVTFNADGGVGEVPVISNKREGDTFALPTTSLTKEWCEFIGWKNGETIYSVGEQFTMPAENVMFIAVWKSTIPGQVSFSQEIYYYNRIGGEDLELPINLNGANIYYVKVDGEIIEEDYVSYNEERKTLVIKEDFALMLADGEHEIKPITDSGLYEPPTCKVVCLNSIKTKIISSSSANLLYGMQNAVGFEFDFNGTTVKSLKIGSKVVSSENYWQNGNWLYISSDYVSKYLGELTFTLKLSNNDVYLLKTYSNVIFTSDYDVTTIHDTTQSNIGHNPLYQYYDNVSIVSAPTQYGFDAGRVLKITPSTVEGITYDCYGYLTLKGPSCSYMWYNVGYTSGKYYAISFDYATESTTRGDLVFRTENSSWSQKLLLGAANDGKVHHFSTILSGDTIGYGTILWAKFVGGGGNVYVDNIKIVELGATTSISKVSDYNGSGNYSFTLNSNGFVYKVLIDGVKTDITLNSNTATIPASVMQELSAGYHTLTVDFASHQQSFEFQVTTGGTVTLASTNVGVIYNAGAVTIPATISSGVKVTRIKRAGTNHWDNTFTNATKEGQLTNYSPDNGYLDTSYIELTATGLTLTSELVNILYGTETLTVEFSNGTTQVLTVRSNLLFFSNWDDAYINEEYGGNVESCQDTAMRSFTMVGENNKLVYTPANAVLSHSTNASADDNGILTFANSYRNLQGWWEHHMGADGEVIVFFDYEVHAPSGSEGNFKFNYFTGGSGFSGITKHDVDIKGSGHFEIILKAEELNAFRIYAPMTNGVSDNAGAYLIIDNFGFGRVESEATKISGNFNTSLAIKSIKKTGIADWDATYDNTHNQDNYNVNNGYMDPGLIRITKDALILSDRLVEEAYIGTNGGIIQGSTIVVTFSDDSTYIFELGENYGITKIFYSNYDTTNIYQVNEGNVESCQDTAMRSLTNDSKFGGNAIVYTPSNAVQTHATNGSTDNGIMTITNSRLNTSGWWQHDFGTTGTAYVGFNYQIILGEGKSNNFVFTWLQGGSGWIGNTRNTTSISATSGYFYMEMPASELNGFYIHCLYSNIEDNRGSYMVIDNYFFGVKGV